MSNVMKHLQERDFIDAVTSEKLFEKTQSPLKVYLGFDPTADSLHLGNLVGIIALEWFKRFGHSVYALIGGATGLIGDPSGKSLERPLLTDKNVKHNVSKIEKQIKDCLCRDNKTSNVFFIDNSDWFSTMPVTVFLRDVGKHFRLGPMLGKESVRARIQSEEGMSFTEFSYQLLQGYDFYYLYEKEGITLEMGGSDQWGNITAGIEYTRKITGKSVYGLTFPLLVRSDGKKFGKSEEGAIWLSRDLCSPYHFYQYLFRIPDADVIKLMRMLTFMDLKEIAEYEKNLSSSPNEAQKRLAEEVTRFVHGEEGVNEAIKITEAASPGSKASLDVKSLDAVAKEMPHITLKLEEILGKKYPDIAVRGGLLSSKSEATRLMKNGGAYLNEEKITDLNFSLSNEHIIGEKYVIIGAGKKKKLLIKIEKTSSS